MPRFSSASRLAVALVGLLLASGCTLKVAQGNPRPNIDLPETKAGMKLVMDDTVQDSFEVPSRGGINKGEVEQWRETLKRGFQNGFGGAFKTDAESPELTLQLMEVALEFAPTAVTQNGAAAAAEAQIRYKARLVDAQGNVVRRSTGTVASKRSITRADEVTLISESAVESMYEKIAEDFFSTGATAADTVK
jgi:hypothetical protein